MAMSGVIVVTSACQSLPATSVATLSDSGFGGVQTHARLTASQQLIVQGQKAMDAGHLSQATQLFNRALKMDPTNPYYNFINALCYQVRAKRGETQYQALAEQGYKLAIRFDPTNAVSFYYLGQLYFDERNYRAARNQFASAVLLRPDDKNMLLYLAAASYYAHDPITTEAALTQLRRIFKSVKGDVAAKAELARISALNKAALDNPAEARTYFLEYEKLSGNKGRVQQLARRLDDWKRAYATNDPKLIKVGFPLSSPNPGNAEQSATQNDTGQTVYPSDSQQQAASDNSGQMGYSTGPQQSGGQANGFIDDTMVAVDVVIIQTVENNSTSMGVNLLHGLELQFGNTLDGTPAYNDAFSRYTNASDPTQNLTSRTITRAIGIPAIKYSLNIANSQAGKSEVLAQPTLVARPGQTSKFFSGVDINAAATSGGAGDSVSIHKLVGIHLTVTPEIAPNNVVLLNVQAERTFLTQPSSSVVFTFRMDTTKTTVDANVAMKFGQTLILSGLSEREIDKNRDGVPLLQDIPIVQYAFSQKTTASYNKSVLILLTPHRIQDGVPNDAGTTAYPTAASAQVQRLKRLHPSWFPAQSTYKTILENLRGNTLFQQFRTGDMPDLVTASASERIRRLKEIANFLYY